MRVIVPILFLFFIACSTHPEPGWIDSQPIAENYWFGVGSVEKPFYGSDIREEARSKALSEIASQISVDISGSFEQVVTEHNLSLDEFAKSVVNTRVENNLPNIEIVDSYESKNRYYLLTPRILPKEAFGHLPTLALVKQLLGEMPRRPAHKSEKT